MSCITLQDCLQELFPDVEFVECIPEFEFCVDVDYTATIGDHLLGIQVKPFTADANSGGYSISARMQRSFDEFTARYGGKVFIVKSKHEGSSKMIANKEVIKEIAAEIDRLKALK